MARAAPAAGDNAAGAAHAAAPAAPRVAPPAVPAAPAAASPAALRAQHAGTQGASLVALSAAAPAELKPAQVDAGHNRQSQPRSGTPPVSAPPVAPATPECAERPPAKRQRQASSASNAVERAATPAKASRPEARHQIDLTPEVAQCTNTSSGVWTPAAVQAAGSAALDVQGSQAKPAWREQEDGVLEVLD